MDQFLDHWSSSFYILKWLQQQDINSFIFSDCKTFTCPMKTWHIRSKFFIRKVKPPLSRLVGGLFSRSPLFFLCFIEKRNMLNSFTLSMFLQSPKRSKTKRQKRKKRLLQKQRMKTDRNPAASPDRRVGRHLCRRGRSNEGPGDKPQEWCGGSEGGALLYNR